jgi:hypothetical protein
MHPTGGRHRKERGQKVSSTAAIQRVGGKRRSAEPAKTIVMAYVERLVRDGLASCAEIDNGGTELTLSSGQVLLLGRTSITRIV